MARVRDFDGRPDERTQGRVDVEDGEESLAGWAEPDRPTERERRGSNGSRKPSHSSPELSTSIRHVLAVTGTPSVPARSPEHPSLVFGGAHSLAEHGHRGRGRRASAARRRQGAEGAL